VALSGSKRLWLPGGLPFPRTPRAGRLQPPKAPAEVLGGRSPQTQECWENRCSPGKPPKTSQRASTCCGGEDHVAVARFLFPPIAPSQNPSWAKNGFEPCGLVLKTSSLAAPTGIVLQSPEGLPQRVLTLGYSGRDRCFGWQSNAQRLVWGIPPRSRLLFSLWARSPNVTRLAAFISDGRGGFGKLGRQV